MTDNAVPGGEELQEEKINSHNQNQLFAIKTGWGLGSVMGMGSGSLGVLCSVERAGEAAGESVGLRMQFMPLPTAFWK